MSLSDGKANRLRVCPGNTAQFKPSAGRVAEWFKAPVLKFGSDHLYSFVLTPSSLISFTKFNSSFHPLPSSPSPLPEVGDHFGDHF
jgi:hypothetical protein